MSQKVLVVAALLICGLVVGLLILRFVFDLEDSPSASVEETEPTTSPGGPGGIPPSGRRVTQADNSSILHFQVGESFLLSLGEERNWAVSIDNQQILVNLQSTVVIPGSQGVYQAKLRGRATLTATGDLPCRTLQPPCLAPSLQFQISVIVDP